MDDMHHFEHEAQGNIAARNACVLVLPGALFSCDLGPPQGNENDCPAYLS